MISMSATIDVEGKIEGGILGGFIRRAVTGESFFLQHMVANRGPGTVLFGHALPGGIMDVDLDGSYGLVVQKGGFLAATEGIEVETKVQGIAQGLFSKVSSSSSSRDAARRLSAVMASFIPSTSNAAKRSSSTTDTSSRGRTTWIIPSRRHRTAGFRALPPASASSAALRDLAQCWSKRATPRDSSCGFNRCFQRNSKTEITKRMRCGATAWR